MIRIGTRTSKLAMIQTEIVKNKILELFPDEKIEIVPIITKGDKELNRSLSSFGGKGVFTKELEDQLLSKEIDLAVHSAKDVPMDFPTGLSLGAILSREDARDVLVKKTATKLADMPDGSVIGTSSLRRELQVLMINEKVKIESLRGNVPTRIQKLKDGMYDGIILAAAGLKRLDLDDEEDLYYEYFSPDEFVPASGQGILAIETRDEDSAFASGTSSSKLKNVMEAINDEMVASQLIAERNFLTEIGGSCNAPAGMYCEKKGDDYVLYGFYKNAKDVVKRKVVKAKDFDAKKAGTRFAKQFKNKVAIVGAGPANKELITKRALECIQKAEAVIYDNLIDSSLLNEAPLDAKLIYVGKRAGSHHMKQDEINELLVKNANEGFNVVRLKGGDPYIFGQGSKEALYLKENGIDFEVVSGVSSSYSVPAFAGIPVTHRGMASSVHIITGHEAPDKKSDKIDYEVLSKLEGTLVFLMGLKNLGKICDELIKYGKEKNTEAAVIESGGSARQRQVVGTLADICGKVEKADIKTPAIIVVGEVAGLSDALFSKDERILARKKIMLTGSRNNISNLRREFAGTGAEIVEISLVETRKIRDVSQVDQIATKLREETYSWISFVSVASVKQFFAFLKEKKLDIRCLAGVKFSVIGRSTLKELEKYGVNADFDPSKYDSKSMASEWLRTLDKSDKVLVVRGKLSDKFDVLQASNILLKECETNNVEVDTVTLYETFMDERRKGECERNSLDVDYVVFSSSSAVDAFYKMTNKTDINAVAIGPGTASKLEECKINISAVASEYTAKGIVEAIKNLERD